MDLDPIGRFVDDFLRHDELGRWEICRHTVFGKHARCAAGYTSASINVSMKGHYHRERRALRGGSDEGDVFAVTGYEGRPLESFAGVMTTGSALSTETFTI